MIVLGLIVKFKSKICREIPSCVFGRALELSKITFDPTKVP